MLQLSGKIQDSTNSCGPCGLRQVPRRQDDSLLPADADVLPDAAFSTRNRSRSDRPLRRPEQFRPAPIYPEQKTRGGGPVTFAYDQRPGGDAPARSRPSRKRSDARRRPAVASGTSAPSAWLSYLDPGVLVLFLGAIWPQDSTSSGRRARGGYAGSVPSSGGRPRHARPPPMGPLIAWTSSR